MSKKKLGNVNKVTLDITEPIKMNVIEMEMNQISILCGKNGAGKSLIMKLSWYLAMCSNSCIIGLETGAIKSSADLHLLNPLVQELMDGTLLNNNLHGTVGCDFDSGVKFEVKFNYGKLDSFTFSNPLGAESGNPPMYMSSETRLYSSFDRYLLTKLSLGVTDISDPFFKVDLLLGMYRIYDILFFERMLFSYKKGVVIPADLKKTLKDSYEIENISEVFINPNTNTIYYKEDSGNQYPMALKSHGEQSLLNMMISSSGL